MLDCKDCQWRHPDTCRECRAEEDYKMANEQAIRIAERIGTVSLLRPKLYKRTLLDKILKRWIR